MQRWQVVRSHSVGRERVRQQRPLETLAVLFFSTFWQSQVCRRTSAHVTLDEKDLHPNISKYSFKNQVSTQEEESSKKRALLKCINLKKKPLSAYCSVSSCCETDSYYCRSPESTSGKTKTKYCICEGTACWPNYNISAAVLEQSGKTSLHLQYK